jgi:D-beta-D-heptose 7-phosphate kinase / D-beta-D-heptose 1-phosphate adenosyltransferase
MNSTDLLRTFENLPRPRILVLGDLILDRYTWGNAERISQEAPVIVLRAEERQVRLGGAGNVCNMLRGLEAEVTCVGVVGDDADGDLLRELLSDVGIDVECLLSDCARPTTVKERFMGRSQGRNPHQILRVDSETRDALCRTIESQLIGFLVERTADHDAVLISDYDKGVCTQPLLRAAIDVARQSNLPVLVDPMRASDYSRYRYATTMTPNRTEAGMATGIRIETISDALQAGETLRRDLDLDFGIVTLDADGIALVTPDGQGAVYPTQPRAVYDITGAGDMVLATIGLCMASGVSAADAVRLGNIAGGLEVEKVGVAVIPRAEIAERLLSLQSGQGSAAELSWPQRIADPAEEAEILPIRATTPRRAAA